MIGNLANIAAKGVLPNSVQDASRSSLIPARTTRGRARLPRSRLVRCSAWSRQCRIQLPSLFGYSGNPTWQNARCAIPTACNRGYPQARQGTSAAVRVFNSGSSSGEGASPRGIGSPHRAQSTSMYHLPDTGKSLGLAPYWYRGGAPECNFHNLVWKISWKFNRTTCRLPPSCRERSMARNYGVPRHTNGNYRASLWPLLTLAFFMVGIIDVAVHLRHW